MNRRLQAAAIALLATAAAAAPAFAHHSGAMFDHNKSMTLTGTIKEYKWQNPHGQLDMMTSDGTPALWSIELSTPNILVRKGWGVKSFAPGDKVTVVMHPMKDGGKAGLMMNVTNAKGAVLKDHDY